MERALGLADSLSVLGVPVPKSKTHRPTAKRTRSAFALQHKRRITADELQPLAGVDKCVCVCFDGGWLNGAFNYPNTHVALVSG